MNDSAEYVSTTSIEAMPAGRKPRKRPPNPIDIHVGQRIRLRRMVLGMSQAYMAAAMGLTFQQLGKYESGANRVSASRLFDLSRILDVPISFFYEDMKSGVSDQGPASLSSSNAVVQPDSKATENDPAMRRETLELVRAYFKISNLAARRRLTDLVKSLGTAEANPEG